MDTSISARLVIFRLTFRISAFAPPFLLEK